jgi:hypothetical protein
MVSRLCGRAHRSAATCSEEVKMSDNERNE